MIPAPDPRVVAVMCIMLTMSLPFARQVYRVEHIIPVASLIVAGLFTLTIMCVLMAFV